MLAWPTRWLLERFRWFFSFQYKCVEGVGKYGVGLLDELVECWDQARDVRIELFTN